MLAPLDNGTVFKTAFTDKTVFKSFVRDIVGIEIEVNKIETEKKFTPKIGSVDFSLDIFAESADKRVIIEIQRVDYDYNFDRFLHYFIMAIAEMQSGSNDYLLDRTVYSIIVLTAPYTLSKKGGATRDEVLIASLDPRNLKDKVANIFGHKLIFLNPSYRNDKTPANYHDWLELIDESIHNPDDFSVNMKNKGVRRVVQLIDQEHISPEQRRLLKIDTQKRIVARMNHDKARAEGEEAGIKKGEEVGIKKGRVEGEEIGANKARLEIAVTMLNQGIPLDKIAAATQLTKEEIDKLRNA